MKRGAVYEVKCCCSVAARHDERNSNSLITTNVPPFRSIVKKISP